MSYLVNQARVTSLTIAGTNFTSNLISWQVSDSSLNQSGFMVTSGTVKLAPLQGDATYGGYSRDSFKRGDEVILDVKTPDGTISRHPRGLLYVVSSNYNVEEESMDIEVTCQIGLAFLTNEEGTLLDSVPIPLDPTQQTLQGGSASYAAAGKYLFQDNQGNINEGDFFGNDTYSSYDPGNWISVLGRTALSVQPLAGTEAIPDRLSIAFSRPASFADGPSRIDIQTTESDYFVTYPAVTYTRVGSGFSNVTAVTSGTTVDPLTTSSCGNTPPPPAGSQTTPSCTEGYVLQQQPTILPAHRREIRRTEYNGPAGQVSRIYSETYGPAMEANSQYFGDAFAYCRYTWSTRCNPNGSCSTADGMQEVLLGTTETINEYGSANELVRSTTESYATRMSAAQPFDWRSGTVDGVPQGFRNLSPQGMYRASVVVTEYFRASDANIQETTTYTSLAQRGVGVNQSDIDALNGYRTFEKRTSTTISTTPIAPDSIVSPQTQVVNSEIVVPLYSGRYTALPAASGPYVLRQQVPVPFLLSTDDEVETAAETYADYLVRWIKGDAYGLVIAEALRKDIIDGWYPGMPFRYVDDRPGNEDDSVLAMRMDATTWGATLDECSLATNGVWSGRSNGTFVPGNNLVGNSRPISGGGSNPPLASTPDEIVSESAVDSGSYSMVININLSLQSSAGTITDSVVYFAADPETTINHSQTLMCFITGFTAQPGSLYSTQGNGGPPANNEGVLFTDLAVIIDSDVFSS